LFQGASKFYINRVLPFEKEQQSDINVIHQMNQGLEPTTPYLKNAAKIMIDHEKTIDVETISENDS
jgi:hypothetical protein